MPSTTRAGGCATTCPARGTTARWCCARPRCARRSSTTARSTSPTWRRSSVPTCCCAASSGSPSRRAGPASRSSTRSSMPTGYDASRPRWSAAAAIRAAAVRTPWAAAADPRPPRPALRPPALAGVRRGGRQLQGGGPLHRAPLGPCTRPAVRPGGFAERTPARAADARRSPVVRLRLHPPDVGWQWPHLALPGQRRAATRSVPCRRRSSCRCPRPSPVR